MYNSIFIIIISLILILSGCQNTDPVSVQSTDQSPDQVESKLFKRAHSRGL